MINHNDIVARLRVSRFGCTQQIIDEMLLAADEIERLRAAIANWSRADQEWLNIDVPTAQAMAKLHEAERALRDAAGLPQPRDRREFSEPDGELE